MLAVIGVLGWFSAHRGRAEVFRTAAVKRGDICATISATGTVEPEQVVDVGAQVTGIIKAFGQDVNNHFVDYGSVVKAGGVVALIDDTLYLAAVDIDKAQLEQAAAALANAKANVPQMKAKLADAEADWRRAQTVGPGKSLAATTYDQYRANYETAKSNMAIALAAVDMAAAGVALAKATLRKDEENLAYCTVKSPVDGVVIDRRVNIGQTIVSSTAASSLFLIAKDLRRIQVWASVNEADIGKIHQGQRVNFTIDAFGDELFQGVVNKIRLNATMSQNVVTYTVEVNHDNSDGKLLPYLTTNLQFEIARRQNVLLVPNAALRWSPRPSQIARASASTSHSPAERPAVKHEVVPESGAPQTSGALWVAEGESVRPVHVHVGLSDGTLTEVGGEEISESLQVVTGVNILQPPGGQSEGEGTSPFVPQGGFMRRGGQAPPGGPR